MNTAPADATLPKTPTFSCALLWGGAVCGLCDGVAACTQAWFAADVPPGRVWQGVASAVLGRTALDGGAATVALGLLMHFSVAFTATAVWCTLYRRMPALRALPVIALGALFGAGVFCAMNYAVLPLLSVLRHFYLGMPVRWVGSMGWAQFAIHLVFVGQPIAVAARRFLR